jgi:hypothetical protein
MADHIFLPDLHWEVWIRFVNISLDGHYDPFMWAFGLQLIGVTGVAGN